MESWGSSWQFLISYCPPLTRKPPAYIEIVGILKWLSSTNIRKRRTWKPKTESCKNRLTCAWTRFFLTTARPDWLIYCESDPLIESFFWSPEEFTWPLPSNFLIWRFPEDIPPRRLRGLEIGPLLCLSINECHGFLALESSPTVRSFKEYLSLARYKSILCLSTEFMSSLTNRRSVCT